MQQVFLIVVVTVVGAFVLAIGGVGVSLALENQDAFCAACHTEPEATYYQQSTQASAVTLAAFHTSKQTACIDCHSGSGPFGRAEGLQQGAHDLMLYLGGAYHKPAVTTNPPGDDTCTKCHANVIATTPARGNRSINGHYHYYLARWQVADPNAARCTTCHTAHTQGLDGLQFMSQGKVAQQCDNCHTALSGRVQ